MALCFGLSNYSFGISDKDKEILEKHNAAKKQIKKLKLLERIESDKLYQNQRKLERTSQDLSYNKSRYDSAQSEMASLTKELDKLNYDFQNLQQATNTRIIQIFKTKRKSYIEFLLQSSDVNNFLDRLYFENIIMKRDRDKIYQLQDRTRSIRALKARIDSQRRYLASSIKSMDRQQKNIQSAISANEKLIHKFKTDRATWEKAERDFAKQSKNIAKMINQQTTSTSSSTSTVASSTFMRPVNGYVSSPYGWRVHPVFKRKIFHSGTDFAMPMNANVKAANSGKVIFVGWQGGYGKVVILDHGKINGVPTTSLYAHLNSYSVATGNTVSKGQVIAKIGTTGYSTGPHLHFEIRQNGNTVNPLNFVSK